MNMPDIEFVSEHELRSRFEAARESGRVQTDFELPDEPWDATGVACVGLLTPENAGDAVEAAARGADVVAAGDLGPWSFGTVRDLERLGNLVTSRDRPVDPLAVLGDDQRALLELLAAGRTIPEAAQTLFLSVRTAERRLGAARRLLGVRSTAEAVLLIGALR